MGIEVLIVDDHPLVRGSMRDLVADIFAGAKLTDCASAAAALDCARDRQFQLGILDVAMPGSDIFSTIKCMRGMQPQLKIAIFTGCINERVMVDAFNVGACALIGKDAAAAEISDLLRAALRGERVKSVSFAAIKPKADGQPLQGWDRLTERERQVARRSADGHSIAQISLEFAIAPATVVRHRHNILTKLGLSSTRQLVAQFYSGFRS